MLENTPDERCHDNGESESDGVMCKEILVVHLFLHGIGFALDGFRVCEDRAVARRVDATDKLFPEGKALQDAEDLVQGELEVPSLGAACPGEEETEKNRIADEQMNRYGNGHDIVEYGMDKSQKMVFDLGAGISGQFRFVQHKLHVFIGVDDDIAVDDFVNDFQIIGQVCIVADNGAFDIDAIVKNDVVADDERAFQSAVLFDTVIVSHEDGVSGGGVASVVFIKGASTHDDGRAAEDDVVLRFVARQAAMPRIDDQGEVEVEIVLDGADRLFLRDADA